MKTLLTSLLLLTLSGACQNKKQQPVTPPPMTTTKTELEIKYKPTISCPPGYPVEVYRGGLTYGKGGFSPLTLSTHSGIRGWGCIGASMTEEEAIPDGLKLIWLSYAEDCMYKIECPIDFDKMLEKFQEGYQDSMYFFNRKGQYKLITYDYIVVGFAPGGVVVVWLAGGGKQVEIGRYQGEKTTVPQAEIDRLDNHDRLLFDPVDRKRTMNNPKIVPPEIQEAHKNKPIPYGLWDTYRERYSWRPIFTVQREGSMFDCGMEMFNGENESLFDQTLLKNEFSKRAIPKRINIGWRDKTGQNYSGTLDFDEKEIFDAFAEIFKDKKDGQAEIELRVNIPNNYITVFIKGNGKELGLNKKIKVDIFESDFKY
jgi:Protein of unknown function (DUF2931)